MTEEEATKQNGKPKPGRRFYQRPEKPFYHYPGTEADLRMHRMIHRWRFPVLAVCGSLWFVWYIRDTVVNSNDYQAGICWDSDGKWTLGKLNGEYVNAEQEGRETWSKVVK